MSIAIVHSRARVGMHAPAVAVEAHISGGLPRLSVVGLPEAAVREAKDRVRSALLTSGFEFPNKRITVNLAPADLPKEGGRFDLPIAVGILCASGQLPAKCLADSEFLGELALDGHIRPVRGTLPAAIAAREANRALVLPGKDAEEAALARDARLFPANHLRDVSAYVLDSPAIEPTGTRSIEWIDPELDLADVEQQYRAKRALEIAAAGRHNLIFIGPPGTGKTMLATRLPGILPPLVESEALEVAMIRSVSVTGFDLQDWGRRPFRAPHHSASGAALVGGGRQPSPGEISLAHQGVLFLDELPEFSRHVLEMLREPMESGRVIISRAARQSEFPADCQIVAAMNPCPCGALGDPARECHCTPEQIQRYRSRISGPLLDRIDLHITVPRIRHRRVDGGRANESSAIVRTRVVRAFNRQIERIGKVNRSLSSAERRVFCALAAPARRLLDEAVDRLALSARARDRILCVARTVADLAGDADIGEQHLAESIALRTLDRGPSA